MASPLTTPLDRVREKIGDVDMTDPLLTDTEIETYIAAWPGNVEMAAAEAAEAIAARFARDFNFQSAPGQVFNRSERVAHYMDLAARLRLRGGQFVWPLRTVDSKPITLRWDLA